MTLKEIQDVVKLAPTFNLNSLQQLEEFDEKVYYPVRKAVANNDPIAIDYISRCSEKELDGVFTAVEDGAIESKNPDTIKFYENVCKKIRCRIIKIVT
jgi:hypothetical protein